MITFITEDFERKSIKPFSRKRSNYIPIRKFSHGFARELDA